MIVLCDVDGVVADLNTEWCRLYNMDYDDHLTPAELVNWDVSRFVKPECGKKIFDYLWYPGLYDHVKPVERALDNVRRIRALGHRVVFVTSSNDISAGGKMRWLQNHGFLTEGDAAHPHFHDVIVAHDKALVKGDALIDDGPHNILNASVPYPIVFSAPCNRDLTGYMRADNWREVVEWVERIAVVMTAEEVFAQ